MFHIVAVGGFTGTQDVKSLQEIFFKWSIGEKSLNSSHTIDVDLFINNILNRLDPPDSR